MRRTVWAFAAAGAAILGSTAAAAAQTGTGLQGDYYNYAGASPPATPFATAPVLSRVDSEINFVWPASPGGAVTAENFAVRWTGFLIPAYSETYTFHEITSDGARLTVNGMLIIDQWANSAHPAPENNGTIALTAGTAVPIILEFYSNDADAANPDTAVAALSWSSPSQFKQLVPQQRLYPNSASLPPPPPPGSAGNNPNGNSSVNDRCGLLGIEWLPLAAWLAWRRRRAPFPVPRGKASTPVLVVILAFAAAAPAWAQSGSGLQGEYWDNLGSAVPATPDGVNPIFPPTAPDLTRLDGTVSFWWWLDSPAPPTLGVDTFMVRWTGYVVPQFSETYTFYTNTDDGVRLWVNGVLLINDWQDQSVQENTATMALTAGQAYPLVMEFYENLVHATVTLSWSSASQPKQIVPQPSLFPPSAPPPGVPVPVRAGDNPNGNDWLNDRCGLLGIEVLLLAFLLRRRR